MRIGNFFRKDVSLIAVIGVLVGLASLCVPFMQKPSSNERLLGKWVTIYSYPISGGVLEFSGATHYLKGGRYNVSGEINLRLNNADAPSEVLWVVDGAGVWTADTTSLSISLNDLKSTPVHIIAGGHKLAAAEYSRWLGQTLPDFSIPSGSSTDFKIISQGKSVVVLGSVNPLGKDFSITMRRAGS